MKSIFIVLEPKYRHVAHECGVTDPSIATVLWENTTNGYPPSINTTMYENKNKTRS